MLSNRTLFMNLLFLAIIMIDIAVIFGTEPNPSQITLPHRQKRLPHMLMIARIRHIKLLLGLSFLREVYKLAVVEACFVDVVDNILVFDCSNILRIARFYHVLKHTTLLIIRDVLRLTPNALRVNRIEIEKLVEGSFFMFGYEVLPLLSLSPLFRFVFCFRFDQVKDLGEAVLADRCLLLLLILTSNHLWPGNSLIQLELISESEPCEDIWERLCIDKLPQTSRLNKFVKLFVRLRWR